MDDAALVVWLLSAAAGVTLGAIWLRRGGLRQRDEVLELSYAQVSEATNVGDRTPLSRRSRLPVWMVSTHAAVALLGLFLWIYYIDHKGQEGTGVGAVPPLIVVLLAAVGTLGILMFRPWRDGRRARVASRTPKDELPPEQRFPAAVVALHGLLGAVTVALVALTALGVGD